LGHLVGDDILKKTANVIRTSLRTYDIVGRYGGEEFMAIMPDTGIETAVSIAERLRRNVAKEVCLPSGDDGHQMVTISIGLSCLQESDSTIEQLIDRADSALYRAKSAGRNRVEVIF
jgi:diguanylate cyclase (GGDEF)-like protein